MKTRIEFGKIENEPGFYLWVNGGPHFSISDDVGCPGEFEGPFTTLAEVKEKAEAIGRKEKLEVKFVK
jgi:hypothetical protein